MTALALEFELPCPCGAIMRVHEWFDAKDHHQMRSTRCDSCRTITTVDVDLVIQVMEA